MSDIVELTDHTRDGLVLIDAKGQVWYTLDKPWWHPVAWLRRWLFPGKLVFVFLRTQKGKVRVQAVKLSRTYVRLG